MMIRCITFSRFLVCILSLVALTSHVTVYVCHAELKGYLLNYLLVMLHWRLLSEYSLKEHSLLNYLNVIPCTVILVTTILLRVPTEARKGTGL